MGVGAAVAGIGAAATLGSSLIGSGKSGGGSQSTTSSAPWALQQPYLLNGFQDALNAKGQTTALGPYSGEFTAGPNGSQTAAENFANNYTGGQGSAMPGVANGTAANLLGQSGNFTNNANNIASNGIAGPNGGLYAALEGYGTGANRTQGPNSGLSSALNLAAVNGANSLGGFTSGLQTAANQGMSDPTSRIANDASIYANNPGVTASLNNVNNQIDQTLNEQTVPQLNREAAMGGNLNSSRAGMAEAMANRDAALTKGNADASILNNAYNTGMGTASGLYASGLNTSVNANNSGLIGGEGFALGTGNEQQGLNEFNTTAQLGAANSGLSQGLGYELGDANTRLAGNSQLGTGLGLGFNGATTAGNLAAGNFALGASGGALQQAGQQTIDQNALQQYQAQANFPWQNLDNYWNIVGNNGFGGTSSSSNSAQLPPNYAGNALGGALAGMGLYQNFGGMFGNNSNSLLNSTAANSNPLSTSALNSAMGLQF